MWLWRNVLIIWYVYEEKISCIQCGMKLLLLLSHAVAMMCVAVCVSQSSVLLLAQREKQRVRHGGVMDVCGCVYVF